MLSASRFVTLLAVGAGVVGGVELSLGAPFVDL